MDPTPPIKPAGYIWLGDAFQHALEALEDYQALMDAMQVRVPCERDPSWTAYDGPAYDAAKRRIEVRMRDALADGELRPLVRPPGDGIVGELPDRESWRPHPGAFLFGLDTYVHPMTNPGPNTGGLPVMLAQQAFDQWLASEQRKAGREKLPQGRRGRPPAVNWGMVETELHRLMEENGDFMDGDAEWNVRARLEERLMNFVGNKFETEVGVTTLRDNIRPMLERWRGGK